MSMITTNTSAPLAKIARAVSIQQGSVTLPIRGVSNAFVLRHIKGIPVGSRSDGISITRAVVLNSILKRLTEQEQVKMSYEYQKVGNNTTALTNFMQYIKDIIENSSKEYAHGTLAAIQVPKGFIVNTIA